MEDVYKYLLHTYSILFSVSDSTQEITATATLVHAQRLAEYAIDGKLYDGQYTFINQYKWIKIELPEVLLIRGVKAFSGKVSKSFGQLCK